MRLWRGVGLTADGVQAGSVLSAAPQEDHDLNQLQLGREVHHLLGWEEVKGSCAQGEVLLQVALVPLKRRLVQLHPWGGEADQADPVSDPRLHQ